MPPIKLSRLPDRTPVKITVNLPPDLHELLVAYGSVYEEVYGTGEPLAELIPAILASFVETDRGFAKRRRSA